MPPDPKSPPKSSWWNPFPSKRCSALERVEAELRLINLKLEKIMASQEEFNGILDRIDTATNNIAADLRGLKDQIGVGMTPAQEDAVKARLEAAAVQLEAVAASTPDAPPVP